ncbi:MAG: AI-2E family transporter [Patescibacteria group bacterium]|nr:MAG: AI-2E family transporter [Patescibacteria group bacterium]
MKTQKIEISSKTIVFTVVFILFLFFLWQIKELIFSLILAFIIAGGLKQPVDFLKNKIKLPHMILSIMVYILFLLSFFYLFYIIIPPLFIELAHFLKKFPQILTTIFPQSNQYFDLNFLSQNIPQLTTSAVDLIKGLFSNIVFVFSVFSFSFYFLVEEEFFSKSLKKFFNDNETEKINTIIKKIQNKISFWFWGELFLMFIVGVLTYIGLFILQIPFALPLAILAGLLEVVPNLGPTIAAIPSIIVGLSSSLVSGIGALVLAILVQQLENNLLVPLVMKKFVGINPVVSLIALIIGGKIAGVLGVLLAIPIVLIFEVILLEILKNKK